MTRWRHFLSVHYSFAAIGPPWAHKLWVFWLRAILSLMTRQIFWCTIRARSGKVAQTMIHIHQHRWHWRKKTCWISCNLIAVSQSFFTFGFQDKHPFPFVKFQFPFFVFTHSDILLSLHYQQQFACEVQYLPKRYVFVWQIQFVSPFGRYDHFLWIAGRCCLSSAWHIFLLTRKMFSEL